MKNLHRLVAIALIPSLLLTTVPGPESRVSSLTMALRTRDSGLETRDGVFAGQALAARALFERREEPGTLAARDREWNRLRHRMLFRSARREAWTLAGLDYVRAHPLYHTTHAGTPAPLESLGPVAQWIITVILHILFWPDEAVSRLPRGGAFAASVYRLAVSTPLHLAYYGVLRLYECLTKIIAEITGHRLPTLAYASATPTGPGGWTLEDLKRRQEAALILVQAAQHLTPRHRLLVGYGPRMGISLEVVGPDASYARLAMVPAFGDLMEDLSKSHVPWLERSLVVDPSGVRVVDRSIGEGRVYKQMTESQNSLHFFPFLKNQRPLWFEPLYGASGEGRPMRPGRALTVAEAEHALDRFFNGKPDVSQGSEFSEESFDRPTDIVAHEKIDDSGLNHLRDLLIEASKGLFSEKREVVSLEEASRLARTLNNRFGTGLATYDFQACNRDLFNQFIKEANAKVFIPAGRLLVETQAGWEECRIVPRSWRRLPFFSDFAWVAEVTPLPHAGSVWGLQAHRYGFVVFANREPEMTELVQFLDGPAAPPNLYRSRLRETLRRSSVPAGSAGRQLMVNATRYQMANAVKRNLLAHRRTSLPLPLLNWIQLADNILKSYSPARGDPMMAAYAVYEDIWGHLMDHMEGLLAQGKEDEAYAVFLMGLDLNGVLIVHDQAFSNLFKSDLGRVELRTPEEVVAHVEQGPYHPAWRALDLVRNIYRWHFLDRADRAHVLGEPGGDEPPTLAMIENPDPESVAFEITELYKRYSEIRDKVDQRDEALRLLQLIQILAELALPNEPAEMEDFEPVLSGIWTALESLNLLPNKDNLDDFSANILAHLEKLFDDQAEAFAKRHIRVFKGGWVDITAADHEALKKLFKGFAAAAVKGFHQGYVTYAIADPVLLPDVFMEKVESWTRYRFAHAHGVYDKDAIPGGRLAAMIPAGPSQPGPQQGPEALKKAVEKLLPEARMQPEALRQVTSLIIGELKIRAEALSSDTRTSLVKILVAASGTIKFLVGSYRVSLTADKPNAALTPVLVDLCRLVADDRIVGFLMAARRYATGWPVMAWMEDLLLQIADISVEHYHWIERNLYSRRSEHWSPPLLDAIHKRNPSVYRAALARVKRKGGYRKPPRRPRYEEEGDDNTARLLARNEYDARRVLDELEREPDSEPDTENVDPKDPASSKSPLVSGRNKLIVLGALLAGAVAGLLYPAQVLAAGFGPAATVLPPFPWVDYFAVNLLVGVALGAAIALIINRKIFVTLWKRIWRWLHSPLPHKGAILLGATMLLIQLTFAYLSYWLGERHIVLAWLTLPAIFLVFLFFGIRIRLGDNAWRRQQDVAPAAPETRSAAPPATGSKRSASQTKRQQKALSELLRQFPDLQSGSAQLAWDSVEYFTRINPSDEEAIANQLYAATVNVRRAEDLPETTDPRDIEAMRAILAVLEGPAEAEKPEPSRNWFSRWMNSPLPRASAVRLILAMLFLVGARLSFSNWLAQRNPGLGTLISFSLAFLILLLYFRITRGVDAWLWQKAAAAAEARSRAPVYESITTKGLFEMLEWNAPFLARAIDAMPLDAGSHVVDVGAYRNPQEAVGAALRAGVVLVLQPENENTPEGPQTPAFWKNIEAVRSAVRQRTGIELLDRIRTHDGRLEEAALDSDSADAMIALNVSISEDFLHEMLRVTKKGGYILYGAFPPVNRATACEAFEKLAQQQGIRLEVKEVSAEKLSPYNGQPVFKLYQVLDKPDSSDEAGAPASGSSGGDSAARGYLRPDTTIDQTPFEKKKGSRTKKQGSDSGPQAIGGVAFWVARQLFATRLFPARRALDQWLQNHRAKGDLIVLDRRTDQMTPLRFVRPEGSANLRHAIGPNGEIVGSMKINEANLEIEMPQVRHEEANFEPYQDVRSEMLRRGFEELLELRRDEFVRLRVAQSNTPPILDWLNADFSLHVSYGILMRRDGVRILAEKQWNTVVRNARERAARDLAFKIAGNVETVIFLGVPLLLDLGVRLIWHRHLPWYGLLGLVAASAISFTASHWNGVWRAAPNEIANMEKPSEQVGVSVINGVRYKFQKFQGLFDPARWTAWRTLFLRGLSFHLGFYMFFVLGFGVLSLAQDPSRFMEMIGYGILFGMATLAMGDHDHYNIYVAPKTGGPLAMALREQSQYRYYIRRLQEYRWAAMKVPRDFLDLARDTQHLVQATLSAAHARHESESRSELGTELTQILEIDWPNDPLLDEFVLRMQEELLGLLTRECDGHWIADYESSWAAFIGKNASIYLAVMERAMEHLVTLEELPVSFMAECLGRALGHPREDPGAWAGINGILRRILAREPLLIKKIRDRQGVLTAHGRALLDEISGRHPSADPAQAAIAFLERQVWDDKYWETSRGGRKLEIRAPRPGTYLMEVSDRWGYIREFRQFNVQSAVDLLFAVLADFEKFLDAQPLAEFKRFISHQSNLRSRSAPLEDSA